MILKKRGFTILELLVVVAIITILVAITIVGINGSRDKAKIAKIQSTMKTFYNKLLVDTNGVPISNGYIYGDCPTSTSGGAGTILTDATLMSILNEARTVAYNNRARCYINIPSNTNWAIAVDYPDGRSVWCVDRLGISKKLPGGSVYGTYSDALDPTTSLCK